METGKSSVTNASRVSEEYLTAMVWRAERILLTPVVRGYRDWLDSLLAPDFYEVGQSGRR